MNGAPSADPMLLKAMADPNVVELLEQLLKAAREGQIIGIAVGVAMGPGKFNGIAVGGGLGEMNLGLDAAKAVVLRAAQQPSNILRVR